MSKKTEFEADLILSSKKATGGAGSSKKNRKYRLKKFANWCWDNNYQLATTLSIGLRHLKLFVAFLIESEGLKVRTVENYMADLRMALVGAGKGQLAAEATNMALGHGDGRGRYVKSVYLANKLPEVK